MFDPLSGDERAMAETASGNDYKFIEQLPDNHQGRYAYRNAKGKLLWVIQRYFIDDKKTFRNYMPTDKKGVQGWVGGKDVPIPKKGRPLYGLVDLLKADPARQVMVVEGEKCRNAVARHYKKVVAVSWMGGGMAWQKTDLSPLYGRPLILVADGDEPGHKAMKALAADLHQRCPKIGLVLPPIAAGGPDIADVIKTKSDVPAWLNEHLQPYEPEEADEGSPDLPPLQSPDSDNETECANLIAQGKDSPGVFFEPETLARLSELKRTTPDRWINLRARIRRECRDVPIQELDRAIKAKTGGGIQLQGQPLEWPDLEPCPEPVDGAAALDDVGSLIRQHVHMPEPAVDAVTLWVFHTWLHERLEISTFLNLTSATRRCGKTLLMEVIGSLVFRPLPVSGKITPAALFRTIELHEPTLLLDETDTFFGDDTELRGIFNGSQRHDSANVTRCVGDDHEPRYFNTWCPKAISGIGSLHDTVRDRSIIIHMERRPPNRGDLARWRDRDKQAIKDIRSRVARFINDNADSILAQRNELAFPPGLHDRARDAWESPLAIADCAGGPWAGEGGRAWRAAEAICADTKDETSVRETLLADIHKVFREADDPKVLSTDSILGNLNTMEGRPWPEWRRGNPLTAQGLASLLKPFGITPGTKRVEGNVTGSETAKGYKRSDFEKVWKNYAVGETTSPSVTTSQPLSDNGYSDSLSVTNSNLVTDTESRKPPAANGCDVVTDTRASILPAAKAFEQSERGAKARRRSATRHLDEPQSDTDDGINQ